MIELPHKKISGRSGNIKPKKSLRSLLHLINIEVRTNGYIPCSSRNIDDETIDRVRTLLTEETKKINFNTMTKAEYI